VALGQRFDAAGSLSVALGPRFDAAGSLSEAHGSRFDAARSPSEAHGPRFDAARSLSEAHGPRFDAARSLSVAHGPRFDAAGSLSVAQGPRFDAAGSPAATQELESDILSRSTMSASAKPPYRMIAILKLPKNDVPRVVTYATHIVESMTNNPWFPSPRPPLASVRAAIDALARAQTATLSKTVGTAATRNARRRDLKSELDLLTGYVQSVADANRDSAATIIESVGMSVKQRSGPQGRVFRASRGPVSGSTILVAPKAGNRASYEWAYSLDGGETWILLPVTNSATTTVTGLKPGARVLFRYRFSVKNVWNDWCDPVILIVD